LEGITGKKCDVILMSDIRLKDKGEEIKKLMGLTRNGNYKLYVNSSRDARGVGIAIKRNIKHEIHRTFTANGDENLLMQEITIKNIKLTLGVVYGPNNTDREFYGLIERKIREWGNRVILGGDYNTILNRENGEHNLDRVGMGRIPNLQNSNILNRWIDDGLALDPFRALYPEAMEISFRGRDERGGDEFW
jgi:exonuclease III